MPDIAHTPVPRWFHESRGRVLAILNGSGMFWLSLFYAEDAINPPGRLPATLQLIMAFAAFALLTHGAITEQCWSIRKGSGLAIYVWINQIGTIIWSEVFGNSLFRSPATSITAAGLDILPLFMVWWLWMVSSYGSGCEGNSSLNVTRRFWRTVRRIGGQAGTGDGRGG